MVKNNKKGMINSNEGLGSFLCYICGAVFSGPDRKKIDTLSRLHLKSAHKTTPKGAKVDVYRGLNDSNLQAGRNKARNHLEMKYERITPNKIV
tara:strand:- start:1252 stop:1530 length:279 start_codon:yes stop_codon:yes gene_type:complete